MKPLSLFAGKCTNRTENERIITFFHNSSHISRAFYASEKICMLLFIQFIPFPQKVPPVFPYPAIAKGYETDRSVMESPIHQCLFKPESVWEKNRFNH